MQAFVLDGHRHSDLTARADAAPARHLEAAMTWLQARFCAESTAARNAARIVYAVGITSALFDDEIFSTTSAADDRLVEDLARAVLAVLADGASAVPGATEPIGYGAAGR